MRITSILFLTIVGFIGALNIVAWVASINGWLAYPVVAATLIGLFYAADTVLSEQAEGR